VVVLAQQEEGRSRRVALGETIAEGEHQLLGLVSSRRPCECAAAVSPAVRSTFGTPGRPRWQPIRKAIRR
jgi:hypothetical protein